VFLLVAAAAMTMDGAGDAALDRATLKGIASVNVVIDPVAPELEQEGATANALRTRTEERLRSAGITVDRNAPAFVALRFTSVRASGSRFSTSKPFAVATTIALYQPVVLSRDRNVRTATQTWEVETVLLADSKQVHQACLDSVDELAGRFVTAYRSVNGADRARD
jgi:hypothetical protein